jgi:hypothetical protein
VAVVALKHRTPKAACELVRYPSAKLLVDKYHLTD